MPAETVVCLKAVEIAVAPIVVAAVMAVKGQPEVALSGAHRDGDHASPATEAAVGIAEFCQLHSLLVVNTVLRTFIKIVSAHEVELTVNQQEGSAGFRRAINALPDIMEISEGVIGFEEPINIFVGFSVYAANGQQPAVVFCVVNQIGIFVGRNRQILFRLHPRRLFP